MKPPEFSVWMFRLLGARRGDELVDLFPGSGAVTRAWERYTAPGVQGPSDVSRLSPRASRPGSARRVA